MAVIAGNEPASKKRRLEEDAKGSSFKKKGKAIEELVVPKEEEEALFQKMQLQNTPSLNLNTIPSLPVHKDSGGTILSSQYWRNQTRSGEKLNFTVDNVSNVVLESLPTLSEDVHESKELLADSATYAWMLLEHLLGGKKAISRTFAYTSSGTCPIERKEIVRIVVKLCDAVVEHMERTFSLANKEVIRAKALSMLLPILNTPYNHMRGYNGRARFPSDESLRQLLKGNSYPESGMEQIADGFDFSLDENMLELSGELYKEDDEKLTVVSRWGRFAMDIVAELVGGIEALNRVQEETAGKMLALIGEDVLEAIWSMS
ncbi:hypothetical protein RvY_02734-2 [Ramazzottius varieornatus]|uniref:Uncharacterized protein n=1 Tax=Ramazzottius varieornatus TaxID=947166 RepID=A0A1D1UVX3_RAMVA|nr:hypothetical protein RvY_02734-2 [Ramazzottius varieornatus]